MHSIRVLMFGFISFSAAVGSTFAADASWPKGLTFALLSTASAPLDVFSHRDGDQPPRILFEANLFRLLWTSILGVANKKVDVALTNLPDIQQMTREGNLPRGTLRVIWVSKLIPNDPIVIRKDLLDSLKQAIQQSLTTLKARTPADFAAGGAWIGGFVKVEDATYQIIRDLNETAKRLAALK